MVKPLPFSDAQTGSHETSHSQPLPQTQLKWPWIDSRGQFLWNPLCSWVQSPIVLPLCSHLDLQQDLGPSSADLRYSVIPNLQSSLDQDAEVKKFPCGHPTLRHPRLTLLQSPGSLYLPFCPGTTQVLPLPSRGPVFFLT